MQIYQEQLDWISDQAAQMRETLVRWCDINTGTEHLVGLKLMTHQLVDAFEGLGGELSVVDLPSYETVSDDGVIERNGVGQAIHLRVRPEAKFKVFLCIHMDTVYDKGHHFQKCEYLDEDTLRGPGVADAKGGLLVMLYALRAFERFAGAGKIGYEVLINPDEEIGSPSSVDLIQKIAQRCDLGMVYEPSLPNGDLVEKRKGSGNFQVVLRGKAAHAGRAYEEGHNAIYELGRLLQKLDALNDPVGGITCNVGRVVAGGAVNIVPDLSVLKLNVRVQDKAQMHEIEGKLRELVAQVDQKVGYRCDLYGRFFSPPKGGELIADFKGLIEGCGDDLGLKFGWQRTGGVCDGNKMAAVGLPNVDTLGPVGGSIHSDQEYVDLRSLVTRAQLSALILMKLADGVVPWAKI